MIDVDAIVQDLIAERERIDSAIAALKGTVTAPRGITVRLVDPVQIGKPVPVMTPHTTKGGRTFTAEQRAAQASRMRAFWRKKRRAA